MLFRVLAAERDDIKDAYAIVPTVDVSKPIQGTMAQACRSIGTDIREELEAAAIDSYQAIPALSICRSYDGALA